MNKQEIYAYVAAIVTTLAEFEGSVAESTVYIALGMDLDLYHRVARIMRQIDVVRITGNRIALTASGRAFAAELQETLDNQEVN